MIYNEEYITTACRVEELIAVLKKLPPLATVDVASGDYKADCEIWYDKDTNTVILK